MKRRTLLIGVGGLAGGSGILGTGAFTSVSAERSVSVSVAGDDAAFLQLQSSDGPNGEYATTQNGQLTLDFTDTEAGGSGLGTDSTYRFDDVFTVTNQGTQAVGVWFSVDGTNVTDDDFWFYPSADDSVKLQGEGTGVVELSPGEGFSVGVHVDTNDLNLGERDVEVTVNASATVDGTGVNTCPSSWDGLLVSKRSDCGDYSTLQDALDAATDDSTIDTVTVDTGTYEPSDAVQIDAPGELELTGLGSASPPTITQRIRVTGAASEDSLTLSNLRIEDANHLDSLSPAVKVTGDIGTFTVSNCSITGTSGEGIQFDSELNSTVETLEIVDSELSNNETGLDFRVTGGETYEITDFTLRNTTIANQTGMGVDGTADVEVTNGLVENCIIRNNNSGIRLNQVESLEVRSSLFESQRLYGYTQNQIEGIDASVTNATITDSTFRSNSAVGLTLNGDDATATLTGVVVENNGDHTYGSYSGINITGDDVDVDIENANIVDNANYGIEWTGSGGNVTAQNCYIAGNGSGATDGNVDIENARTGSVTDAGY